jgi:hypothetical protein
MKAKVLSFETSEMSLEVMHYLRMWYNMAVVVPILCCVWRWGRSSLSPELFSACAGIVLCKVLICRVIAVSHGCMCVCARAAMELLCNNVRCRRTKFCGVRQ